MIIKLAYDLVLTQLISINVNYYQPIFQLVGNVQSIFAPEFTLNYADNTSECLQFLFIPNDLNQIFIDQNVSRLTSGCGDNTFPDITTELQIFDDLTVDSFDQNGFYNISHNIFKLYEIFQSSYFRSCVVSEYSNGSGFQQTIVFTDYSWFALHLPTHVYKTYQIRRAVYIRISTCYAINYLQLDFSASKTQVPSGNLYIPSGNVGSKDVLNGNRNYSALCIGFEQSSCQTLSTPFYYKVSIEEQIFVFHENAVLYGFTDAPERQYQHFIGQNNQMQSYFDYDESPLLQTVYGCVKFYAQYSRTQTFTFINYDESWNQLGNTTIDLPLINEVDVNNTNDISLWYASSFLCGNLGFYPLDLVTQEEVQFGDLCLKVDGVLDGCANFVLTKYYKMIIATTVTIFIFLVQLVMFIPRYLKYATKTIISMQIIILLLCLGNIYFNLTYNKYSYYVTAMIVTLWFVEAIATFLPKQKLTNEVAVTLKNFFLCKTINKEVTVAAKFKIFLMWILGFAFQIPAALLAVADVASMLQFFKMNLSAISNTPIFLFSNMVCNYANNLASPTFFPHAEFIMPSMVYILTVLFSTILRSEWIMKILPEYNQEYQDFDWKGLGINTLFTIYGYFQSCAQILVSNAMGNFQYL